MLDINYWHSNLEFAHGTYWHLNTFSLSMRIVEYWKESQGHSNITKNSGAFKEVPHWRGARTDFKGQKGQQLCPPRLFPTTMTSLEVTGKPDQWSIKRTINESHLCSTCSDVSDSRVAGNQHKGRDYIREATLGKLPCFDVIQLEQKAEKCQQDCDRAAIYAHLSSEQQQQNFCAGKHSESEGNQGMCPRWAHECGYWDRGGVTLLWLTATLPHPGLTLLK